jgi:GNAT superfamily N-acetyltransferase
VTSLFAAFLPNMLIHTNKDLALKLETAESLNQVSFVQSHNQLIADSQACFQKIGSGYAIFAGLDSPLTQIFGLALDGEFKAEQIDELEDFYKQRKAPVNLEVCHLSDITLSHLLIDRSYQITEYSNVLLRQINPEEHFELSNQNQIHKVGEDEIDDYAVVISEGFLETKDIPDSFPELFKVCFNQPNCSIFGARKNDRPAGGGALFLQGDVALLGGASTLPEYRNQGIQTDLLKARLAQAQAVSCQWAMVTTSPGSVSQKNVERQGFQVVYARTKFTREW